jgi:tyrosine-protein kinase Etk/Wzc
VSNVGALLAAAGKRVLLVDADLRRGALHRSFGLEARPGFSELLAGDITPEQAARPTGVPGLDLIACGAAAAHPAELLASPRLDEVLAALSKRYDVVLLDTAPTLAVTDPVLTGRCASLNLLVLRSRQHPVAEIELALERFGRSGVQVHGAIVNDARAAVRYGGRAYGLRGGDAAPNVA